MDKTPSGSVEDTVRYAESLSPVEVLPKESLIAEKSCRPVEIVAEKVEIPAEAPDEPDVYHSPVSPLHYPENSSRER